MRTDTVERATAKAREWLVRYAPTECAAVLGTLLGTAASAPVRLAALTAYGSTIGEELFFYAFVAASDLRRRRRAGHPRRSVALAVGTSPSSSDRPSCWDTAMVRPLCLYLGPLLLVNLTTGVIAGKIVADLAFYAVAIAGYELGKAITSR